MTSLPRQMLAAALAEGRAASGASGGDRVIMLGGEVAEPVPRGGIVVTRRPVTEAVKVVEEDRVVGFLDRADLAETALPMAIHSSTLRTILAEAEQDPIDLAIEVAARGGRVVAAR